MEFISGKIGSKINIETKLRNSKEAIIATAYFCPRDPTMESLKKVRNLKLIYSDEYQITDPEKLWKLVSNGAEIRYVPTRDTEGKLHAKIYCGIRKKGSKFAFVGSGNLTNDGLFNNQEAGVLFDSENTEDHETIEKIFVWLTDLWAQHERHIFNETKYAEAKSSHEAAKRWLRKKPKEPGENHPWKENTQTNFKKDWKEINYWMLKTTAGKTGQSHWQEFYEEQVIAIDFPDESNCMVRKFKIEFEEGDMVLICRGYNITLPEYVRVYGVARVTGPYRNREPHPVVKNYEDDGWPYQQWHMRRKADVRAFPDDFKIPRETLAACLESDLDQRTGSRNLAEKW